MIYKSVKGSTKQYAEWIHLGIEGSELFPIEEFDANLITQYDVLIIGGRNYMGRISITSFLEKNWKELSEKPIHIFSVGIIPADHPDSMATYQSIPEEIREHAPYLKLPGRIKLSELNFVEKLLQKAMKKEDTDQVDERHISPIIKWAKSLTKQD